jgi:diadenosine tetraphosphate (Ap4A) HIT family hydrolase
MCTSSDGYVSFQYTASFPGPVLLLNNPADPVSGLTPIDGWETAGVTDCVACELSRGERDLPGGLIHRTDFWLVEHCIGPLGVGTLIVKPERHVTSVGELGEDEAAELGPLLRRASTIAGQLTAADQVYNCLWSHAGGRPVHIQFVVQPVTTAQMSAFGAHGPQLQAAMFSAGQLPGRGEIEAAADKARLLFAA